MCFKDDYISISRQAAVDAIYDAFSYAYCDNCEKEMNEDLCEDCHRKYQNWSASKKTIERVFNNLSSAQLEQRWIPVTERLPEKKESVIVTVNDGAIYTDTDDWTGEAFWTHGDNVIAWRELPEPWKEGEVDEANN